MVVVYLCIQAPHHKRPLLRGDPRVHTWTSRSEVRTSGFHGEEIEGEVTHFPNPPPPHPHGLPSLPPYYAWGGSETVPGGGGGWWVAQHTHLKMVPEHTQGGQKVFKILFATHQHGAKTNKIGSWTWEPSFSTPQPPSWGSRFPTPPSEQISGRLGCTCGKRTDHHRSPVCHMGGSGPSAAHAPPRGDKALAALVLRKRGGKPLTSVMLRSPRVGGKERLHNPCRIGIPYRKELRGAAMATTRACAPSGAWLTCHCFAIRTALVARRHTVTGSEIVSRGLAPKDAVRHPRNLSS